MNRVFAAFVVLAVFAALGGCTANGSGTLVPIKAVGSANGDLSGPQVFIAGIPVNALVKVHGNITYTVQVTPPYLTYDGDFQVIVEPLPGKEAEAQAAVTRGDILIRRAGVPGALNRPGTRDAFIAGLVAAQHAREAAAREAAARAQPQPLPPPAPAAPLPLPMEEPPPAPRPSGSSSDPIASLPCPSESHCGPDGKGCDVPGLDRPTVAPCR